MSSWWSSAFQRPPPPVASQSSWQSNQSQSSKWRDNQSSKWQDQSWQSKAWESSSSPTPTVMTPDEVHLDTNRILGLALPRTIPTTWKSQGMGIANMKVEGLFAKQLFTKGEFDWSYRCIMNGNAIGLSLQRSMIERTMHGELVSLGKTFRTKRSPDGILDVCRAFAMHYNLPVPDAYTTYKDLKVLAAQMFNKMMENAPKPAQEASEGANFAQPASSEIKWKMNEDGTFSHNVPFDAFALQKKYIRMPDGSWMELQTNIEVQVSGIQQAPAAQPAAGPGMPAIPASPSPVLTMEIPGLENITKKLDSMMQGQQKADLAISSLQLQLAEEKRKRKAAQALLVTPGSKKQPKLPVAVTTPVAKPASSPSDLRRVVQDLQEGIQEVLSPTEPADEQEDDQILTPVGMPDLLSQTNAAQLVHRIPSPVSTPSPSPKHGPVGTVQTSLTPTGPTGPAEPAAAPPPAAQELFREFMPSADSPANFATVCPKNWGNKAVDRWTQTINSSCSSKVLQKACQQCLRSS